MGHRSYYKLRSILEFLHQNSSCSSVWQKRKSPETAIDRYGYSFQYQGLQLFSTTSRETLTKFGNVLKESKEKVQPAVAIRASSRRYFPSWARWILGSMLTVLPFSKEKWEKLQAIEGKAEIVVEDVENIAEVVEKVAIVAEKVSSEVADKLPDNGRLKETALFVERVSKKAVQDAQLTKDFIHKVDELKHDLQIETEPRPVIKAKQGSEGK
ncbi:hypothetical protein PanWU01x14_346920 [Parasponia andersonii]|uniref:Uncharacterized protein n=1 Tax=Parasponia andersonii TaxID=3476 RepID=A0A2P5AC61_PARAD|nr:hypothetical protein PanWU01x14_346920 [Parasponia andersonii]